MIATAYLLDGPVDFKALGDFKRKCLARKVFGQEAVAEAVSAVLGVLRGWGYSSARTIPMWPPSASSCSSTAVSLPVGPDCRVPGGVSPRRRQRVARLHLRCGSRPGGPAPPGPPLPTAPCRSWESPNSPIDPAADDVRPEWPHWVERWEGTSTLTRTTRHGVHIGLLKVSRWLQAHYPQVRTPCRGTAIWLSPMWRPWIGCGSESTSALGSRGEPKQDGDYPLRRWIKQERPISR